MIGPIFYTCPETKRKKQLKDGFKLVIVKNLCLQNFRIFAQVSSLQLYLKTMSKLLD